MNFRPRRIFPVYDSPKPVDMSVCDAHFEIYLLSCVPQRHRGVVISHEFPLILSIGSDDDIPRDVAVIRIRVLPGAVPVGLVVVIGVVCTVRPSYMKCSAVHCSQGHHSVFVGTHYGLSVFRAEINPVARFLVLILRPGFDAVDPLFRSLQGVINLADRRRFPDLFNPRVNLLLQLLLLSLSVSVLFFVVKKLLNRLALRRVQSLIR